MKPAKKAQVIPFPGPGHNQPPAHKARDFNGADRLRFSSRLVRATLEAMNDSGLSYAAIARHTTVSTSTLYKWDAGTVKRPRWDTCGTVLRSCLSEESFTETMRRLYRK